MKDDALAEYTFITLSAWLLWDQGGSGAFCDFVRCVFLDGSGQGWRWSVFEGLEVIDDVVSNQRAATEGPPINNSDTERRMEVFIFWQLLKDSGVE